MPKYTREIKQDSKAYCSGDNKTNKNKANMFSHFLLGKCLKMDTENEGWKLYLKQ